jgi:2'-hydroxyisoflavone reductase
MPSSRRRFLKSAALGGAGLWLAPSVLAHAGAASRAAAGSDPAGRKLKLLVLGGTRFLGPALVERALERGHAVTLFNRGKSNPEMFKELEQLRGDRDPNEGDGLGALEGRKWDAVLDTSGFFPRMVDASASLLAPNVGQYVFISTLSVYGEAFPLSITEDSPVATIEDPSVEEYGENFENYGPLKALCEQAAEKAMPGRTTNLRPGLIVGYRDNVPRFTYWPVRVERGGEVLSPGNPDDPVQYIDARDLARFAIHTIEQKITGVFNVNGPAEAPTTIAEVLYGCKAVTGGSATFTWVDAEFLAEKGLQPWAQMPLWIPPEGEYEGFHRLDCGKAVEAGFTTRPLAETVRETLEWYHEWPEGKEFPWRGGIEAAQEAEVLKAWHARKAAPPAPPAPPKPPENLEAK